MSFKTIVQPEIKIKLFKINSAIIYAIPLLVLFIFINYSTEGNFTYSLEDPYIHLELAKNIFNGHYGINTNEFSSPSSSILWPFLISIFTPLGPYFEYIPLVLNSLITIMSCFIISGIFENLNKLTNTFVTLSVTISLNIFGLAITGMENSLQVLLTLIIIKNILLNEYKPLLYISLFLLPLIRYEGLSISIPVLAYLFLMGNRKQSILIFGSIFLLIGGFSIFLYVHNHNILPSSVLSKSVQTNYISIFENLRINIKQYGFLITISVAVSLFYYRKSLLFGGMILSSTFLFFLFGRIGWFGRYEVFILLFILIPALYHLLNNDVKYWPLVFTLPVMFFPLFYCTLHTHQASSNIYRQPVQISLIANMLNEPIAINDLGNVSFRTNVYVLDLWGLGSIEALNYRQSGEDPQWISYLMNKKNVHFAAVNSGLFPKLPDNWIEVGRLLIHENEYTLGSKTVHFFATSMPKAKQFQSVLQKYNHTGIPSRTSLTLTPLPH